MLSSACALFAATTVLSSLVSGAPSQATHDVALEPRAATGNDFSCKSAKHPNPVVILHGLGATKDEDLNFLQAYLQALGYCTFSTTYGEYEQFPYVGGLKPIAVSSQEIGSFITEVKTKTNANKIDIVGHSEGAFQSLYTPKFAGVGPIVDKIVAIAPPIHGTSFGGTYNLARLFGNVTESLVKEILGTVGCQACSDLLIGGEAVKKLNTGTVVQPGNTVTIIASKYDELVTPLSTTQLNEPGVNYVLIQKTCPLDFVGHIGEAYDLTVWNLVINALDSTPNRKFLCTPGSPGR